MLPERSTFNRRLAGAAVVLTAGALALLWFFEVPLGVPGEWVWLRIVPHADELREIVVGASLAAVAAAVYLAIAWMGAKRLVDAARWETAIWLVVLSAAGFAWLWIIQQCPADEYRLQKAAFVLYYPGSDGYFYEARYDMRDARSFLAEYESKMREGDVLHVGTHPPGLFLLHRGLIVLTEASPGLTAWLNDTQPREVREMFDEIERNTFQSRTPLASRDRAALWLAALLTQCVAAATVIPLYLCLRGYYSRDASWLAASLWPLVPALAVFLPKSDALYPFIGMLGLYWWLQAWRRNSVLLGFAAGLWLWLGLFFSLALLPVAVCGGLLAFWEISPTANASSDPQRRTVALVAAGTATGFLLPVGLLWMAFDLNLPVVWSWNYRNHAGFYDQFDRTYWKWLLVNLLELFYGVGAPVFVLMLASYRRVFAAVPTWRHRALAPYIACGAVWILLWLSGKNMGEAARLWLFLMPWPIWLSAACFEPPVDLESPRGAELPRNRPLGAWFPFAGLQALVCIATVLSVYGFRNQ